MGKVIVAMIVLVIAILYFSSPSSSQPLNDFKNELHNKLDEKFDLERDELKEINIREKER